MLLKIEDPLKSWIILRGKNKTLWYIFFNQDFIFCVQYNKKYYSRNWSNKEQCKPNWVRYHVSEFNYSLHYKYSHFHIFYIKIYCCSLIVQVFQNYRFYNCWGLDIQIYNKWSNIYNYQKIMIYIERQEIFNIFCIFFLLNNALLLPIIL
jgi:hypothetical protein